MLLGIMSSYYSKRKLKVKYLWIDKVTHSQNHTATGKINFILI